MEELDIETYHQVIHPDYEDLQHCMDKVIGKIGLQKTVTLLQSFIQKVELEPLGNNAPLVHSFLVSQAVGLFDLKRERFYDDTSTEYREARMITYHLYQKYTALSYAKIAKVFNTKKRNVIYYKQKVDERLSIPHYYKPFMKAYNQLEERCIQFISKL